MERDAIKAAIIRIFEEKFEIVGPSADDNLRDAYEFDSIDAVELLHEIEILLDTRLTQAEKKNAMEIRTINQIVDYIEALAHDRCRAKSSDSDHCLPTMEQ
jgi:acyl carrier protein